MFSPMRIALLILLSLCIFGGAHAGSVGTTLGVSANVIPACSVSTSSVAFGDYDTIVKAEATGNIDVTCTSGTPYNIALDAGANFVGARRLSEGANYLEYYLYDDVTYLDLWGDSDFAATTPYPSVADVGNGAVQPHTVYGRIPGGQNVPVGSPYSDVVNVTIHY